MKSFEKLLEGFEPDFEFKPLPPIPKEEFEARVRRIRAEAADDECDALILHTDMIGWYHTSNSYLRYVCDWVKEGILILPTDEDKPSTILSFFDTAVLWPPPGEPTWIDDIRQIGMWGRSKWNRRGDTVVKLAQATKQVTDELGLSEGKLGLIGDQTAGSFWKALEKVLPKASFQNENRIINKMQVIKTKQEQDMIRGAAQLIDIGFQALCHVCKPGVTDFELYAAFTFAQMSRGGESGDQYQIGINPYGTLISKPYGHVVRPGDAIILYVSGVTYRGYNAQTARMVLVGEISKKQEDIIAVCIDGVKRAMDQVRPGALVRDVHHTALQPFIEKGYIPSSDTEAMPWIWQPNPDGTPRKITVENVRDEDYERMGRNLRHVYPPNRGPQCMGHSIGMLKMPLFWLNARNGLMLEPGMTFVVHTNWFEAKQGGCLLGSPLLVTDKGFENLGCHTPLEPYRIKI